MRTPTPRCVPMGSPSFLAPVAGGIAPSEHIEADGATVFQRACEFGCEGSYQRYRSGRTKTWLKIKNPDSPALTRVCEC
jgi:ATP-dependent DNA ligase